MIRNRFYKKKFFLVLSLSLSGISAHDAPATFSYGLNAVSSEHVLTHEQQEFIDPIAELIDGNLKLADHLIKEYFDVKCKKPHSEFMEKFDLLLQSTQDDILVPLRQESENEGCVTYYGSILKETYGILRSFYDIVGTVHISMKNLQKRGAIRSLQSIAPLIAELQTKGKVIKEKAKAMEPSINRLYDILRDSAYFYVIESIKQLGMTLQVCFIGKSNFDMLSIFNIRLVKR